MLSRRDFLKQSAAATGALAFSDPILEVLTSAANRSDASTSNAYEGTPVPKNFPVTAPNPTATCAPLTGRVSAFNVDQISKTDEPISQLLAWQIDDGNPKTSELEKLANKTSIESDNFELEFIAPDYGGSLKVKFTRNIPNKNNILSKIEVKDANGKDLYDNKGTNNDTFIKFLQSLKNVQLRSIKINQTVEGQANLTKPDLDLINDLTQSNELSSDSLLQKRDSIMAGYKFDSSITYKWNEGTKSYIPNHTVTVSVFTTLDTKKLPAFTIVVQELYGNPPTDASDQDTYEKYGIQVPVNGQLGGLIYVDKPESRIKFAELVNRLFSGVVMREQEP